MEALSCAYCHSLSKYYCACKTPHVNFCKSHLDKHGHLPGYHQISLHSSNRLPVNPLTKLQLLSKLNEVSNSSKFQISALINNCSEAISKIETHTTHSIENLNKFILLCDRIAKSVEAIETIEKKLIYSPLESALLSSNSSRYIENITGPVISFSEANLPQYSPSTLLHFIYNYTDLSLVRSEDDILTIYPDNININAKNFRGASRCLNIGNKTMLITGGKIDERLASNSAYILEIGTGKVTELAPMSKPRMFHSMTWIDGFPGVIGGNDGGGFINSVEIYRNAEWEEHSQINIARGDFTSICSDREVWIIGGFNKGTLACMEKYKDGDWKIFDLKLAIPVAVAGLCFLENYLLLFGGYTRGNKNIKNVHSLDIEQIGVKEHKSLEASTRFPFNTVFVGDRKIYALGNADNGTIAAVIEINKIIV